MARRYFSQARLPSEELPLAYSVAAVGLMFGMGALIVVAYALGVVGV